MRVSIWVALVAAPGWLMAQERPLRLSGTVSTGYYNTYTKNGEDQSVSFVPFGASFDAAGYLIHPDLLSFEAQPQFNVGPQASEAGFLGGNGIRLNTTFLGKRSFPLKFRYTNLRREDVFFGSLTQFSAYSYFNRDRELGVNWELKADRMPHIYFDWGTSGLDSKPDLVVIPDYRSRSRHGELDVKDQRWGWEMEGSGRIERLQSDLFQANLSEPNQEDNRNRTFALDQTVKQAQAIGRRNLWGTAQIQLMAGQRSISSSFLDTPIDQTARYGNANLSLIQTKRVKAFLRGGYTSNLLTQEAGQTLAAIGQAGPAGIAPDNSILRPLNGRISNLNGSGAISFELPLGFGLFTNADANRVRSSGDSRVSQDFDYRTGTAGVSYHRQFRHVQLSGQYGRTLGRIAAAGVPGTIRGQNYGLHLQHGTPDRIELTASVDGASQSVRHTLPLESHTLGTDTGVARRIAPLNVILRAGAGWQQSSFLNAGNEFNSHGFTARGAVEHPRLQVSYSLNSMLGSTLPLYLTLLSSNPITEGILLPPIRAIPNSYRGTTVLVHASPVRKFEFNGLWTHARQRLDGLLNNDFELAEFRAGYHFRLLLFEAGYVRYDQVWLGYMPHLRGRFYLRISRNLTIIK